MTAKNIISSAGSGIYTPEGYAEALLQYGPKLTNEIKRALWRVSKIPRAIFIARFASRGVGKGVFGHAKSGAYKLVRMGVAGPSGGRFTLAMELRGFAALQEKGGHTNPPRKGAIFPKSAKALKLKIPSLGVVFAASAKHRGAVVHADPSAPRAFQQSAARISAEIENAIVKAGTGIGIRKSGVVKGAA